MKIRGVIVDHTTIQRWVYKFAPLLEVVEMKKRKGRVVIITKLGKPITVGGIHGMIDPLGSLFPDRKLNPQTIRMSVICNWLNENNISLEKAQELAGHKWPGTTEKYIKVNSSHQR